MGLRFFVGCLYMFAFFFGCVDVFVCFFSGCVDVCVYGFFDCLVVFVFLLQTHGPVPMGPDLWPGPMVLY